MTAIQMLRQVSAPGEQRAASAENQGDEQHLKDGFVGIELRQSIILDSLGMMIRKPVPAFRHHALVPPAFEISGTNFGTSQKFRSGAAERDEAVDHDVAAMREF